MISSSQKSYLRDLILRHPNFKQEHPFDTVFQEGLDGDKYLYEGEAQVGLVDEVCARWVMDKYRDYVSAPVKHLNALTSEDASGLISHLKLGEEERLSKE